ncbi:hypothetical protein BpHYR1_021147 [Brachionus plicatilis]|uniref:Uncharacterized protein n=1 Tax=Brachionus plicatilis TaxID=10195 RepID=A0A3M7PMC9_BRAPC|nr:hypothetical protein BpHYR1_021147 [Brachionus plicatilis]
MAIIIKRVAYILNYVRDKILKKNKDAIANYQIRQIEFEIKIKRSKYKLEKINVFRSNNLTCHVNRKIKLFQFE